MQIKNNAALYDNINNKEIPNRMYFEMNLKYNYSISSGL